MVSDFLVSYIINVNNLLSNDILMEFSKSYISHKSEWK